jgi:hypothetical protein
MSGLGIGHPNLRGKVIPLDICDEDAIPRQQPSVRLFLPPKAHAAVDRQVDTGSTIPTVVA